MARGTNSSNNTTSDGIEDVHEGSVYGAPLRGRRIRLIDIEDGNPDNTLSLKLTEVDLDTGPAYSALSYVWGDSNDLTECICNYRMHKITKNLNTALKQLRALKAQGSHEGGPSLRLWVDAVCINQSDNEEKTLQVRMMKDIFQGAEDVIAWLGETDEITERGIALLSRFEAGLIEHLSSTETATLVEFVSTKLNDKHIQELGLPGLYDEEWECLWSLMENRLFTRVWIIQELLTARKLRLLLGDKWIATELLLKLGKTLPQSQAFQKFIMWRLVRDGSPWGISIIFQIKAELKEGKSTKFLELLYRTVGFQSKDPRDKIFALVGLIEQVTGEVVDYNDDSRTVLLKTAKAIILESGSLDFLAYTKAIAHDDSLPSWLPDWISADRVFHPDVLMPLDDLPVKSKESCETVAKREDLCKISEADGSLRLTRKKVDILKTVVRLHIDLDPDSLKDQDSANDSIHDLSRLVEHISEQLEQHNELLQLTRSLGKYPNGRSLDDVYWRSRTLGLVDDIEPIARDFTSSHKSLLELTRSRIKNERRIEWLQEKSAQKDELIRPFGISFSAWFALYCVCSSALKIYKTGNAPLSIGAFCVWLSAWPLIDFISTWLSSKIFLLYESWVQRQVRYFSDAGPPCLERFYQARYSVGMSSSGRSFCITEAGYIGFAAKGARVGDELCFFEGSLIPFVVRKGHDGHGNAKGAFTFIGDCYVHGFMKGEKIEGETEQIELI